MTHNNMFFSHLNLDIVGRSHLYRLVGGNVFRSQRHDSCLSMIKYCFVDYLCINFSRAEDTITSNNLLNHFHFITISQVWKKGAELLSVGWEFPIVMSHPCQEP